MKADDVLIRPQRPADDAAVHNVVARAFGGALVADLAAELRGARASSGLSWVAERDGRLVGHVQLCRSWLDAVPRLVDVLVLSPLSVLPEHQRHGVGSVLVRYAVRQAEQVGAPLLFLEGSPDYYGRLGFRPASVLGFVAPSVRIPDAAFQVVVLPGHEPWMGGALVYPDTFWAYDCVGLRDAGP